MFIPFLEQSLLAGFVRSGILLILQKTKMKKLSISVLLLGAVFVSAQEQEKEKQIEDVVIVGNRNVKRTKLETPVPVDVINIEKFSSLHHRQRFRIS